jgi:hypothetical protein
VEAIIYKRLDETYNINPNDYDGAFDEPEVSTAVLQIVSIVVLIWSAETGAFVRCAARALSKKGSALLQLLEYKYNLTATCLGIACA